jgi:hypothetical protein
MFVRRVCRMEDEIDGRFNNEYGLGSWWPGLEFVWATLPVTSLAWVEWLGTNNWQSLVHSVPRRHLRFTGS